MFVPCIGAIRGHFKTVSALSTNQLCFGCMYDSVSAYRSILGVGCVEWVQMNLEGYERSQVVNTAIIWSWRNLLFPGTFLFYKRNFQFQKERVPWVHSGQWGLWWLTTFKWSTLVDWWWSTLVNDYQHLLVKLILINTDWQWWVMVTNKSINTFHDF